MRLLTLARTGRLTFAGAMLPLVLVGCASHSGLEVGQPRQLYQLAVDKKALTATDCSSSIDLSEHDKFVCSDSKARPDTSPPPALANVAAYREAGFAYSQYLCGQWFDALELARRGVEYRQGSARTVGTLATTSMATFRSSVRSIAAASALFGATDAWFNLGKATFLLTPDVGKLQALTTQGQSDLAARVRTDHPNATYAEVKQHLNQHHQMCSLQALQRAVSAAVDLAKYEITLPGDLTAVTRAQVIVLSADIDSLISVVNPGIPIPDPDLRILYYKAILNQPPPADARSSAVSLINAFVVLERATDADSISKVAKLRRLLARVGALAGYPDSAAAAKSPAPPSTSGYRSLIVPSVR